MKALLILLTLTLSSVAMADFRSCIKDAKDIDYTPSRNIAKMHCVDAHIQEISFSTCIDTSMSLYGSSPRNMGLFKCLKLKDYSFNQCIDAVDNLYHASNRNAGKRNCLEKFEAQITYNQCMDVARSMYSRTATNIQKSECRETYL